MRASRVVATLLVAVVGVTGVSCGPARISQNAREKMLAAYEPDEVRLERVFTETSYNEDQKPERRWSYANQWRQWKEDPAAKRPDLCVAMSGGGLRSAAFNIGVLSGLYESTAVPGAGSVLERVDMMSAVSGGASALAWYYTQHYHLMQAAGRAKPDRDRVHRRLFTKGLPHQEFLAERYSTFNVGEYVAGAAANVLFAPVNLFANGVFGGHVNTSPMRRWYEGRLRALFQRNPLDENGPDSLAREAVTVEALGRFAKAEHLPFFIFNTTALIERDSQHLGARLGNSVFNFTPYDYGSDAFGRHGYGKGTPADDVAQVSRVVSISSAAFDGAALVAGPTQSALWSMLNIDTGLYADNPSISKAERHSNWWRPFPLYFMKHYLRDNRGTEIYLTDGGHAENLGAYALVQRGCRKIIVIDAEHDPVFDFQAYVRLADALRAEMGLTLKIDKIDEIRCLQCQIGLNPIGARWKKAAKHPVMEGGIWDGTARSGAGNEPKIPVLYVKMAYLPKPEGMEGGTGHLALNRDEEMRRRRVIDTVFKRDKNETCDIDENWCTYKDWRFLDAGKCPFPHRRTRDQDFTPEEYRAWRNLGWLTAAGHSEQITRFVNRP